MPDAVPGGLAGDHHQAVQGDPPPPSIGGGHRLPGGGGGEGAGPDGPGEGPGGLRHRHLPHLHRPAAGRTAAPLRPGGGEGRHDGERHLLRLQVRPATGGGSGVRRAVHAQSLLHRGPAAPDGTGPGGGGLRVPLPPDPGLHGEAGGPARLFPAAVCGGGEDLPHHRRRLHRGAPPVRGGDPRPGGLHPAAGLPGDWRTTGTWPGEGEP